MNIFVIALVFLFIGVWFFLDSPSQKIGGQDLGTALVITDLRSIAACAAHTHLEILAETEPTFQCTEKYEIDTIQICVDTKDKVIKCAEDKTGKFPASFVITHAPAITNDQFHNTMKIVQQLYPTATNFGILAYQDEKPILIAADGSKRDVPPTVIKDAKLESGQLIYMTKIPVQIPGQLTQSTEILANIICAKGQAKIFKQGKWQCVSINTVTVCTSDTIWSDSENKCVVNPMRRPLCANTQTAIQIEDRWECIDPLQNTECGDSEIARLNYSNMLWECVPDPNKTKSTARCSMTIPLGSGSGLGKTYRVPVTSCTDCEELVTNPETCETKCIPAKTKLSDLKCYSGKCNGAHSAFYFGFPNVGDYIVNAKIEIPELANTAIPVDVRHSQNRRFNCMDCGTGYIDDDRSMPPYVAVCVGD